MTQLIGGKPEVAPHPRRWAGLAILSASLLLVVMDMTVLNVALPSISKDLKPSSMELLWMVDIYALVLSGMLVTVSALGDRWGRKKMLLSGFFVFGIASMAILFVQSSGGVIAVRALLGVGGAMIMPSTLSMIRTLFTDAKERAFALGIWASMAALGGALGPILGGALLERFSWHSAFLVNVPVMAVAIAAGIYLLPESRNPNPGPWDALSTVLSMVGMVGLVYAIKHFGKDGLGDPVALISLGIAVIALFWFVRRCLASPTPLLEIRLFSRLPFSAGVIAALATSLAMAAMMLLMAQWMQLVQGYSPLETGFRLLPTALGAGLISPLAPKIAGRLGARTVLAGGLAVAGLGFFLIFLTPPTYPWMAVSLFLIGSGMGSLAVASAVIMSTAPIEKAGSAAAIEETAYELGGALGVASLGSVAAAVYRDDLQIGDLGITGKLADTVKESLGGALDVAQQAGPEGLQLAERAKTSFTDSLETVGLYGAVVMLAATIAIWLMTPHDLDVNAGHH